MKPNWGWFCDSGERFFAEPCSKTVVVLRSKPVGCRFSAGNHLLQGRNPSTSSLIEVLAAADKGLGGKSGVS
jgi:hypothetical protein